MRSRRFGSKTRAASTTGGSLDRRRRRQSFTLYRFKPAKNVRAVAGFRARAIERVLRRASDRLRNRMAWSLIIDVVRNSAKGDGNGTESTSKARVHPD